MSYRKCRICKKNIKQTKGATIKLIHRRCWLKYRTFDQRIFDKLFCNDRKFFNKECSVKPS